MTWYCLRWPDGRCLHVHSRTEARARDWCSQYVTNRAVTIQADACQSTGQSLPVLRHPGHAEQLQQLPAILARYIR